MTVKYTDTQTVTTTGVKNPATLTKWPEGGATASVGLTAGTATVELRTWVNSSDKEVLATFMLGGAEPMFGTLAVFSIWADWEWNVTAISGGGTLRLDLTGIGL
jgi:hypothetical protein